ncbi:DNA repair ATPase [Vibrio sp. MACH09]|uniref:DUF2802 domain-containing protein n=1 Tax=unclassified Vibrio TaxID=2614977 RepID=UPI001493407C|nr:MULTISPECIES: DUF2802 domain-containing protein [unclassified Vibrio]NOI65580.1 DUF2802 domain-containing protein [Vibrio sp. 99-8-1]GLO61532.1 DNA repair ATPase [Vibrio sp. MACH09]
MVELFNSNGVLVLLGGSLFFVLVLVVMLLKSRSQMQRITDSQRQTVRGMEKEVSKANNQLLEVRSVVVGLGQKVAEQQDVIQYLSERVTELEHTDKDSRMYSRASKMVQLGADVDELIEECELPKAEAELMMTLQNKIAGKEKVPPMNVAKNRPKTSSR